MPSVLITGASRGLGLEFARQYAADGWTVIATCRNPIGVGELATIKGDVAVYGLDVANEPSLARFAQDIGDKPIDVLINNAGIHGPRGGAEDVTVSEWMPVMQTNVMSPLLVSRALIDNIRAGARKQIVNISSMMGSIDMCSSSGSLIYRSSKAALNMVMKCYASELAPEGICVTMFHPGWVRTDMGGPQATLSVAESIGGMRKTIDRLTMDDTGTFKNYDGKPMPW